MLGTLITLFVVGLAAMVAAGIALAVVGVFFSLALAMATFLLFKVAPLLLLGFIVLKLVERWNRPARLSDADRKWLEGRR